MQRAASFGCWPDDRQRLLLGAAVWGDERARGAWDRWRASTSIDQVTFADIHLLATAYRPLRRLGADDPMLTLAGGVYRRTWYLNQLSFKRAARVVAELRAGAIETVVLKGVALSALHYGDVGARVMGDVDLLVYPDRLDAAVQVLGASGWQVLTKGPDGGPLRYGTHVYDQQGTEIDIHAYALMQSADDSDLWETRVPLDLMGTPAFALAPADQLLHVCAHGLRWDETPSVRWAADAMAILRSAGTGLDWERLVERTRARRLTVAVGRALAWLRESLEADIPAWVPERLQAGPRLHFERAIHRLSTRPPTRLGLALMSFDRYRRFVQLAPPDARPESFARFLRSSWDLDSSTRLLVHGGLKLAGRTNA